MRPSAILWSDSLQKHELDSIELVWRITAATTVSFYSQSARPEITFGFNAAGTPTQELGATTVANLVGSGVIDVATSLTTTVMGTDVFAFVLSTKRQLTSLDYAEVSVLNGATGALTVQAANCLNYSVTNYPNTLPTAGLHRIGATSTGDAIGIIRVTGLDALTSGFIKIKLYGRLK